jgi:hypothetical protein
VCLFGLILSWQWRGLTIRGFEIQHAWAGYGTKAFGWPGLENPLEIYAKWAIQTSGGVGLKDWIARYAKHVVWLFFVSYLLVGLFATGVTFLPLAPWNLIPTSLWPL